ncbi:Dcm Site-specific DNA methylase [uncultured Caudovirales phage]|uniref:Cytosine-specific methyltransferase n=1 Tax=uncultured Caudovirales phage TaxID=2100421 RepID=A0A6J7X247_9CAUD|nr:Dcm Site-specific DNA methylase [uncultured Caudovirales phage]
MTLTYGSLFAGVGGFDMGMEQAGYEPVFQVEWDKNCQKILHHHWPTVPKWGDVCDVNGADLPPCDVLIFGSPCQDLSVAGKRAGLQDGDRSSMFFEAVRIIKEMRDATNSIYPRATIWENVPGALSSNKGADFGVVLSSMADIGAITQEYAVLDAQYFRSTPQRRRRIFLVSIFDPAASERCPDPLLPLIQGSRGDFAKGRKARKDAARLAEGSVDPSDGEGFRMLAFGHYTSDDSASTIQARDHKYVTDIIVPNILDDIETVGSLSVSDLTKWQTNYQSINAGLLQVVPFVKSRRAQSNSDDETWVEGDVTPTLNAFDNSGESRATVLMPFVFDGTRHDDFRMDTETVPTLKQRMGTGGGQVPMLAEPTYAFDTQFGSNAAVFEDQSPTLKSSQQPPSVSPPGLAVRRLTPLECERLMGWPDDHTRWTADGKEQADTNRYKQCGNGVASCVAKFVGEQLRPVLETK